MALINGNNSDNALVGTRTSDQVFGFNGNDSIFGEAGDDLIDGGDGDDRLGSVGRSSFSAETGNDTLLGGSGSDLIDGGPDNDFVEGGAGNDTIYGDFPDARSTVAGNDVLVGGPGSDAIAGGGGFDVAYFESPRRAYTVLSVRFDFPSDASRPAPTMEQGIQVTRGDGATAEVDTLIEVEELRFADGRNVTNAADPIALVYRLYDVALDRAPDPIGLNGNAEAVFATGRANVVANGIATSAEFQSQYGALDNTGFVQQLYRNAFGREGDGAGVADWVASLNAGATRGDVLLALANSPESVAVNAPQLAAGIWDQDENAARVARLYDTAFNRLPDIDGFLANKAVLDAGGTLEQLTRSFAQSAEFTAVYGGPNVAPATLVDALYVNTLNRQADPDGLAFWTGRIQSGATTREQAIIAFSESLEHQILMLPNIEGGIVFA